jgi:hypothetical protein
VLPQFLISFISGGAFGLIPYFCVIYSTIMAIPSFFKQRKPRQFKYNPIFFDSRKEELEKRVRLAQKEAEAELSGRKPLLERGQMQGYFRKTQKVRRESNYRLIFIFIVLVFLAYWLFFR